MRIGSLFSGIGGLDLGVEYSTGADVVWMCDKDPFCRRVLVSHWPDVPIYEDVQTLGTDVPLDVLAPVDMLIGGFPCQNISALGDKEGIDGEKSGLWRDYARLIRDLRPRYVFVENVADLAVRGLDRILADLASFGFDAEWTSLRACDVGAPHLRRRLFLLAWRPGDPLADADILGRDREPQARVHRPRQCRYHPDGRYAWILRGRFPPGVSEGRAWARYQANQGPEPGLLRSPHGPTAAMDVARDRVRVRSIGNAVMPRQAARALEALAKRANLDHLIQYEISPRVQQP